MEPLGGTLTANRGAEQSAQED